MKRIVAITFVLLTGVATLSAAETWKNVPIVDTQCLSKVKANPDAHTKSCMLQCQKNGYGIIASDGAYLKLDPAGNQKALAALKASKKSDALRATVTGERNGDTIKVASVTIQ